MMKGSRMAGQLLKQLGPRLFSTATLGEPATEILTTGTYSSFFHTTTTKTGVPGRTSMAWVRFPAVGVRHRSTMAMNKEGEEKEVKTGSGSAGGELEGKAMITSYWGISPSKVTKEDGTEWKWSCFRPWETYKANTSIDLKKHHIPNTMLDKLAYWTVKTLRYPTDLFFKALSSIADALVRKALSLMCVTGLFPLLGYMIYTRYDSRAMLLETVAAVPGMAGGMLLHLKSLRRFEHSGGWIKALLEEAENERMHLMTFQEISQPRWFDRALVFAVQGVFFNAYFLGYLISPKFAHRVVGYLEEEAIHTYTEFLKELDNGNIKNVPAPAIAIDYWQMAPDSTLRDVVVVLRADEAHHRDVNHFASDIHYQGLELREAPAPIGYH